MFGPHLECNTALAATRDKVLSASRLNLLLLHLEHLMAQRCSALVRHHTTAATAAIPHHAMVLQFDQLQAECRQHSPRCCFEPAAAHDLAGVVEGRAVADLFEANALACNQLVQELGHVNDAYW